MKAAKQYKVDNKNRKTNKHGTGGRERPNSKVKYLLTCTSF